MAQEARPRILQIYVDENGKEPFTQWLNGLKDARTRARIRRRLDRVRLGNLGDYQGVGEGVFELRLFFGPGYRIYFGEIDDTIVLLLCGGDKSTQSKDIKQAQAYWKIYQEEA